MPNGFNPNDLDWPPVDLEPEAPTPELVLESEIHHWEQRNVHVAIVSRAGNARRTSCTQGDVVIFAGNGSTDEQGLWKLDLDRVHCRDQRYRYGIPSVVATPFSRFPRIVTLSYQRRDDGRRLQLQTQSWLHGGDKIGFVSFSWHCVVPIQLDVEIV